MYSKIPPIKIIEGNAEQAVAVSRAIPEFVDPPVLHDYKNRLESADQALVLIALVENEPVGFKVGYTRDNDGSFYSWMGGVLPGFRRIGVAQKLADAMERWATGQGYTKLRMKTRNQHRHMLLFAIRNGFIITGFKPYPNNAESRILLEKVLT